MGLSREAVKAELDRVLLVPGEASQLDFTWTLALAVTVRGEPALPMLCHVVLPSSNWS